MRRENKFNRKIHLNLDQIQQLVEMDYMNEKIRPNNEVLQAKMGEWGEKIFEGGIGFDFKVKANQLWY